MLRDRSIAEVVRHLDLVMPSATGERQQVSNGALVQARDRLGAEPLAWLFHATAAVWATASADEHRWRGLAVLGLDGSTLRVPDSEENNAYFGRAGTSRGEAAAAYPQLPSGHAHGVALTRASRCRLRALSPQRAIAGPAPMATIARALTGDYGSRFRQL